MRRKWNVASIAEPRTGFNESPHALVSEFDLPLDLLIEKPIRTVLQC